MKPSNIYLKFQNERGEWLEENENTTEFLENLDNVVVSNDLNLVGNEGKYQHTVFFIFAFTFLVMGFLNTVLSYSYYVPEFYCKKDLVSYKCSQKEACELGNFDVLKKRTSLVTEFELYCGKKKLIVTSSQSYIFIFAALGTFCVAMISDKIGRKRCFYIMIFCSVSGCILAIFSEQLFIIITGVLLIWTSTDIFYSIALIYFNEVCSDYLRSKVSLFFILASIGSISINFFLIFIPSYKGFYTFCFFFVIIYSCMFSRLTKSPFYVFSTGNIKEYFEVLMQIATRNQKDEESTKIQFENNLKFEKILSRDISKVDVLKIDRKKIGIFRKYLLSLKIIFGKKYIKKILLCFIYYSNNYITSCVSLIMPQKLGIDNIYIMSTLLCLSDFLGYLIIVPFSHLIKRRHLNCGCNIAYLIGGLFLLLNETNKGTYHYKIITTILSCFLRMVNSAAFSLAFNYISELFPTKFRGLATGLIVCTGRLSNCLASTFEHLSTIYDIHPLILTAIPSIFAIPACLLLPETVKTNLIN